MARSVAWRRTCPDLIAQRMEQALQSTIYILHETGPTAFVLKEEGSNKKVKVFLGDPHICSCSTNKKEHDLCIHILWVLLRKFRVPRENPVTFQLGLVEREVNEILQGYLMRQSPETDQSGASSGSHDQPGPQREVGPEDVCPICQEELLGRKTLPLTYCRFGCGKSVHIKCMKIWAEHQKSTGEKIIRCPLCRENFGSFQELCKEHHSASSRRLHTEKTSLHLGITCSHCHMCPIAGKCYHCVTCASYHLCHACFCSNQVHLLHHFEFRKHPSQPWRPAFHPNHASLPPSNTPTLPPALINTLQNRSLTEEDYELLLQLDQSQSQGATDGRSPANATAVRGRGGHGIPERIINSFHVEPVDSNNPLLQNRAHCEICSEGYQRGNWVRKLPCKHKFHRECIDEWLRSGHSTCPVDGQSLYNPAKKRQRRLLLSRRNSPQGDEAMTAGRRMVGSLAKSMRQNSCGFSNEEFTISGQSIGMGSPQEERGMSHQLTTKRAYRPNLVHSTKSTSSHTAQNIRTTTDHSQQPCRSNLLPLISSTSICAQKKSTTDGSKRDTMDKTKQRHLRRQNRPPHHIPTVHNDSVSAEEENVILAPVCNGYHTTKVSRVDESGSLPSVSSSSPHNRRLALGSVVAKSGRRGSHSVCHKDDEVELDSSMCVSSFKLCPILPSSSSSIIASKQS